MGPKRDDVAFVEGVFRESVNWWLACFCRFLEFEPLAYSGFMCIMA